MEEILKEIAIGVALTVEAVAGLLGLEFELAADIIGSVVSPTWRDIGELAAIAVIRTFLNYFLERDLENSEPAAASIS